MQCADLFYAGSDIADISLLLVLSIDVLLTPVTYCETYLFPTRLHIHQRMNANGIAPNDLFS